MSPLINLFSGPENVVWFVAGMFSVQLWQWIKAKWKDRKDPGGKPHTVKKLNWFYVWTGLVLAVIVMVGIQNQTTYSFAEKLAKDTRACQIEFNKALVANREINAQDRDLMVRWAQITYSRAQQLSYLAKTYGATSPTYLDLKSKVDREYFVEVQKIEEQRLKNEADRSKVPYPEPTCGK